MVCLIAGAQLHREERPQQRDTLFQAGFPSASDTPQTAAVNSSPRSEQAAAVDLTSPPEQAAAPDGPSEPEQALVQPGRDEMRQQLAKAALRRWQGPSRLGSTECKQEAAAGLDSRKHSMPAARMAGSVHAAAPSSGHSSPLQDHQQSTQSEQKPSCFQAVIDLT